MTALISVQKAYTPILENGARVSMQKIYVPIIDATLNPTPVQTSSRRRGFMSFTP